MNVRSWPLGGGVLAVLWLFVRGVALEPAAIAGEFLLGLAFGLPLAFVFRRLYSERTDPVRTIRAAPYALLYVLTFVKELLTANIDVAYRTLAPWASIEPRVIVFPLRVETDLAITSIANSISLTPGTLTMDYDPDLHALYLHALDVSDPESVVAPIRAWEDYALVIFDEPGKPGDPIPELPRRIDREGRANQAETDARDRAATTEQNPGSRENGRDDSADPPVGDTGSDGGDADGE